MLHARSPCRYSDALEAFHGEQAPNWPTDPYLFLIWRHCGYPASDAACAKGWAALRREIGVEPDRLLAAALKAGGMVPELREEGEPRCLYS
jgi:hypothetical protein